MPELARLEVASAEEWRRWLSQHHQASPGVWLVFRKDLDPPPLAYTAALDEALCFGWIDSIVRRVDDARYLRKFTPRRDARKWSEANKRHARRLIAEKRMTAAGRRVIGVPLDAADPARGRPAGNAGRRTSVPRFVGRALRARPAAQRFFASLSPGYRERYIGWIMSAKREETRQRRLAEALDLLEKGVKSLMK